MARTREGSCSGNLAFCATGRRDIAGEEAVCSGWRGIPGWLTPELTATLKAEAGSGLDRIEIYAAKPSTAMTPASEIIQALLKFPPLYPYRLSDCKHHYTLVPI